MPITVTSAASSRGLLTDDELAAATGEPISDPMRAVGLRVADLIAATCMVAGDGVHTPTLLRETLQETVRLPTCGLIGLVLSRRFVGAATVVLDGATLTADTDYELNTASAVVLRLAGDVPTRWCGRKVVVTYQAGFATAPDGLKQAAATAMREQWSAFERDPLLKSETIDGLGKYEYWVGGVGTAGALSPVVMDMLGPYMTASL